MLEQGDHHEAAAEGDGSGCQKNAQDLPEDARTGQEDEGPREKAEQGRRFVAVVLIVFLSPKAALAVLLKRVGEDPDEASQ